MIDKTWGQPKMAETLSRHHLGSLLRSCRKRSRANSEFGLGQISHDAIDLLVTIYWTEELHFAYVVAAKDLR